MQGLFPMCSPIEFLGNKGQGKIMEPLDFIGEPGGIRTHDPMIKSHSEGAEGSGNTLTKNPKTPLLMANGA